MGYFGAPVSLHPLTSLSFFRLPGTRLAAQRLEVLEGAELEGRRLADLLEEEKALQSALRKDAIAAREVCAWCCRSG